MPWFQSGPQCAAARRAIKCQIRSLGDPGDTGPGAWTARSETARYRVLRWGALDRDLSPLCRRTRGVRSLFRGGTSWPPATDGGHGRRQSCAGRSTASRRKCDGIEIGAARGQLVINIRLTRLSKAPVPFGKKIYHIGRTPPADSTNRRTCVGPFWRTQSPSVSRSACCKAERIAASSDVASAVRIAR